MEQYPPAVPQQQNKLRALVFLEVGLFEIGFVTVVLLLLFGTLNYFNILPVSEVFPNQLGWLPRQQSKLASPDTVRNLASQGESLQSQSNSFPTPTPILTISLEKTARQIFSAFVAQNLNASITIPNNIYPVIPSKFEKDAFDYTWTIKNSTVSAHFKLSSDYKGLSYLNLSIVTPQNTTPSAELSEKIASQFLSISPQDIWKCKTINELISCENFWQDQNGIKKGIDITGPVILADNQKVVDVFLCEFHKGSSLYESKSCSR